MNKDYSKPVLFFLLCFIFSLYVPQHVHANEVISIAVPYLPSRLDIHEENEPLNTIILGNISTPLFQGQSEKNPVSAKRISRISAGENEEISQIWELEFSGGTPLDKENNLGIPIIRNTIESLRTLREKIPSEEMPNSSITKLLDNLHSVYFSQNNDRFNVYFNMLSPMPDFPQKITYMPILDKSLADIFGGHMGKGTNAPFFGAFMIEEYRPDEELKLVRNSYYGFPGDQSKARGINFRVFDDYETLMRALRSGSISIIVLPSRALIEDAKRDRTLAVIPSPFSDPDKTSLKLSKTHWGSNSPEEDEMHTIEPGFIITRKSLQLSAGFNSSFDMRNISKGEI